MKQGFRCILHGSFRKHFDQIQRIHKSLTQAGIEVIVPKMADIVAFEKGFALLEGQEKLDPRLVELLYLQNLKHLGKDGFSFFVNPGGYIGTSASYELGIAQTINVPCFFLEKPADHPVYLHKNSVWSIEDLITFIKENGILPEPKVKRNETELYKLWSNLMVPGSVVAIGGIIELDDLRFKKDKPILLVKTHKWGGRYSIVGGKVLRNERLQDGLAREVKEETGLSCQVGEHLCTFDQIKNSGYYLEGIQQIFIDNVVKVSSRKVILNDEAQEYLWVPAKEAIETLSIEPNALHTIALYAQSH